MEILSDSTFRGEVSFKKMVEIQPGYKFDEPDGSLKLYGTYSGHIPLEVTSSGCLQFNCGFRSGMVQVVSGDGGFLNLISDYTGKAFTVNVPYTYCGETRYRTNSFSLPDKSGTIAMTSDTCHQFIDLTYSQPFLQSLPMDLPIGCKKFSMICSDIPYGSNIVGLQMFKLTNPHPLGPAISGGLTTPLNVDLYAGCGTIIVDSATGFDVSESGVCYYVAGSLIRKQCGVHTC